MFSEEVREITGTDITISLNGAAATAKTAPVYARWQDWDPARVSHHGTICCEIAREWLTATDFSALAGGSRLTGPRWLSSRFQWGPSTYPVHWCEAVGRKVLDCGVLAAFAHEAFIARGVPSYRVQFVQRFSDVAAEQWRRAWSQKDAAVDWVGSDLIYHEGCAVEIADRQLKIWDASAGWWVDPKQSDGYGSVLAVRVMTARSTGTLSWGPHDISPNTWCVTAPPREPANPRGS